MVRDTFGGYKASAVCLVSLAGCTEIVFSHTSLTFTDSRLGYRFDTELGGISLITS